MLSPAKLNLFLAVTGRRADGFHDLLSVVAPLAWGDELAFEPTGPSAAYRLVCDRPEVPAGDDNLILRAARAYAAAVPGAPGGVFHLTKRIPMGAGLGGGSSNAAVALRLLQEHAVAPLENGALLSLAAGIGSDCPLFLQPRPLIMRGRGERLSELPPGAAARIAGRRVLVFKPGFGIGTPWAYRQLAAGAPASYLAAPAAEERLTAWCDAPTRPLEQLLFNSLEAPAYRKHPAMPAAAKRLRERFGLDARMTGSGSAMYALLPDTAAADPSRAAAVAEMFGPDALCLETGLTQP